MQFLTKMHAVFKCFCSQHGLEDGRPTVVIFLALSTVHDIFDIYFLLDIVAIVK